MGESRTSRRARSFASVALAAILTVLAITSVGAHSAAASEADSIGTLVNQARAAGGQAGLLRNAAMDAPSRSPGLLASETTASTTPFPIGYVVGGVLVVLGVAGGIYGQLLRLRGRRPPGS